jgi:hypothetical protein
MTEALEGSVFRRRLHLGEGVRAYRFDRQEPRRRITVIWAEEGEQQVRLPLSGRVEKCFGHLGQSINTRTEGTDAIVSASTAPVFVVESVP